MSTFPLTVIEYSNYRRQSRTRRPQAAVRMERHQHPVIVAVSVVALMPVLQGIVSFLYGVGVGVGLAAYDADASIVQSVAVDGAAYVVVPVLAVALVFIAREATYRVGGKAWLWLLLALTTNVVVNVVVARVVIGDAFTVAVLADPGSVVVPLAMMVGIYVLALGIGMGWAERTRDGHALLRAFRQLAPEDRRHWWKYR